ncbi:MAG: MoxR family ATPase [Acidimicrobiia bacterium]|nr:MoxR family ATPase [Acidimicrobiia bacterium]
MAARFSEDFERLEANVGLALKGKADVVRLALICLFAEGHLLLEDVPGVGKTSLARAIAASVDVTWQRIQFTPDLLPSDVTGVSIYNQATQEFEFHPGPIFANIVIGDEINRASPKTQSAMLEVMEERQVTVEGHARPVNRPFMVIATQNPIEMDGTYRLPEAQLDRFLMRIGMGYPDEESEVDILRNTRRWSAIDALEAVLSGAAVQRMIEVAAGVHVSDPLLHYVRAITAGTRTASGVRLGVSPRGSLAMVRAARVLAASEGRAYVTPEDVKVLAGPVLSHRILLTSEAEIHGRDAATVVDEVLAGLPVPVRRS